MSEDDEVLSALTRLMSGRRGREIYGYERENSRARILQTKPWLRQRIGRIERRIHWVLPHDGKPIDTGTVARAIYEPLIKPKDGKPFRLKMWQRDRVRKALPTFADRIERSSTGKGRPFLWRIRWGDSTFCDARARKRARWEKNRRRGMTFKGRKP